MIRIKNLILGIFCLIMSSHSAAAQANGFVTLDDYPKESLINREQGTAKIKLLIKADGKVGSCSVVESSGFPRLDDASCSLMLRRGRFDPATDDEGKPTEGYFDVAFKWVLP